MLSLCAVFVEQEKLPVVKEANPGITHSDAFKKVSFRARFLF